MNMALSTKRSHTGRLVPMGGLFPAVLPIVLVAAIALSGCCVLAASPDPALCPYELGYNPIFNADGSQLLCSKAGPAGSETFAVDATGANAKALRGVGQTVLAMVQGAVNRDGGSFDKYVANDATFVQPAGAPGAGRTVGKSDPDLDAFNRMFDFAPGIDVTAIFEVSAFKFLGGNPLSVQVHIKEQTRNFVLEYDGIYRLNDIGGGQKLWQLYRAFNPKPI